MEGTVTISIKDFEMLRGIQTEYEKIIQILECTLNDDEVTLTDELVEYISNLS